MNQREMLMDQITDLTEAITDIITAVEGRDEGIRDEEAALIDRLRAKRSNLVSLWRSA